ncbi:enoyl-CoA hydratase/isomerase family protein [Geothrix sp. 21YS21S-4]|uniref:enoyl-CoA hydratase/isomerase family protein n=1 Tax=Geothrix sp. 21YS21S-4 TaxID=3068889 RepID=UPI0027BA9C1D|nr:enoyl-CoA hydratase/isomerase family protein [Geothrix sp. 21YS21S-4]
MRPEPWHEGPTSLDLLRGADWAWIGLRSADGLHRLHSDLLVALDRLFIDLRWSGVRRLVLSGAAWMAGGGGHFSAGADLHEVGALDPGSADPFSRRGQRVMSHLLWPGWRTLTLISGVAMGGGCDLALHGQERWAAGDGLRLAHPAAKHGILTGFGGTVRLPEVLGPEGAARLFRGFETWEAEEALAAGAIHRIVPAAAAREAVLAWLASGAPQR